MSRFDVIFFQRVRVATHGESHLIILLRSVNILNYINGLSNAEQSMYS